MANKFGTNSHGFYDYIYTAEHGIKGAVELITQGKVFSREIIVPDGTNRKLTDIETELFQPLTKDPAQAEQIVQQAMEIAKFQGLIAARDFSDFSLILKRLKHGRREQTQSLMH